MSCDFKKFFDIKFLKFIIVGIANTIFGTAVMFCAYNILNFNYWISSALNYILGSILSYFLNKYFTFQNKSKNSKTIVKFIINISVCYFIAYGAAKPIVRYIFSNFGTNIPDNLSMFAGMCLFVILNYIGQRYFAFKE